MRYVLDMIQFESIFSRQPSSDESDCDDDDIIPSKEQIPVNKAFLTIARVEPVRTISASLDELDNCLKRKYNALKSINTYSKRHEPEGKVRFEELPEIHTLSTISELSDSNMSSPYCDPSDSDDVVFLQKSSSWSLEKALEIQTGESDFTSDDDNVTPVELQKRDILSKFTETMTRYHSLDSSSNKVNNDIFQDQNKGVEDEPMPELLFAPRKGPNKSILKSRPERLSGLQSEPTKHRRSLYSYRNSTSLSQHDLSAVNSYLPSGPKKKKISAPARLFRLRSSLKANQKFLQSVQQTKDTPQEVIEMLVKQAAILNEDIRNILLYNTLKWGGLAALLLLTCVSVGYCVRCKK